MVEIARRAARQGPRALAGRADRGPLANARAERLFDIVRRLEAEGVAILYVSHRLHEVFSLCDCATVLRDGATVGHLRSTARPRTRWCG